MHEPASSDFDSSSSSPYPPAPPALEEPSLPDARQIWRGLKRYRVLIVALLVSALVHALILTIGVAAGGKRSAPSSAMTIRLASSKVERAQDAAPGTAVLSSVAASASKPLPHFTESAPAASSSSPPPSASRRSENEKPADFEFAPAPPALFSWWQYADPDLGYFPPNELDRVAVPLNEERFLLPLNDNAPLVDGRVVVRLYIGENGQVDRVEIRESEPPGLFDEAVLKELYRTRFTAALKDGRAVKSRKDLEIFFGGSYRRSIPSLQASGTSAQDDEPRIPDSK